MIIVIIPVLRDVSSPNKNLFVFRIVRSDLLGNLLLREGEVVLVGLLHRSSSLSSNLRLFVLRFIIIIDWFVEFKSLF